MITGTSKSFSLHVRCPYGDFEDWVTARGRMEPLEQLLATPFAFECPVHGVQSEIPLEAAEKRPAAALPGGSAKPRVPAPKKPVRSSERKAFHVPVFVYGWSKSANSFHEDTTTLVFNASGALVRMVTPVELGEDLFLVNKFTREEQRVRVVFVEPHHERGMRVGLAFQKPVPMFWRKTRRGLRAARALRVVVRGKDRNGNAFAQSSSTLDISADGARLEGIAYLTAPGDIIEVKRRWHGKARFRVAWIGQIGSLESNQVGVSTVEPGRLPWRVKIDERQPTKPSKKS
jgi:hypothetical protein